ncbi:MAG: mitochondrial fission ELM1 family protein [Lysobacter sp.]|nr:mitochondrial fission ELM1 family protein [Lysobacter sp.]
MTNVQRPDPQERPERMHPEAWTLTDGAAGNVRQAEALASAMGLAAEAWTLQPRAPWRWVAPRRWPGSRQAFGPAFATALGHPPALVVGCGRQAALATRLARERGARALQILDPRLTPAHWDLLVVPSHDGLRGDNVIPVMGSLNPVDDLWLAAARRDFAPLGTLPGPRTALLVGGATHAGGFDVAAFERWLGALVAFVRGEGGSVLATASRRTPAAAVARLQANLEGVPGVVWAGTARAGEANPYPGLLGWADRIVCTADSVNMLSEAAATNVPVYVAGAAHGRPGRFVEELQAMGRVRPLTARPEPFDVTALRETARVAAEARQRLGLWDAR